MAHPVQVQVLVPACMWVQQRQQQRHWVPRAVTLLPEAGKTCSDNCLAARVRLAAMLV